MKNTRLYLFLITFFLLTGLALLFWPAHQHREPVSVGASSAPLTPAFPTHTTTPTINPSVSLRSTGRSVRKERTDSLAIGNLLADPSLDDTVEFFNLVLATKLSAPEKQDLVAFVRTL